MGFFDKYPYTDFHELNLDWIIKAMKDLGVAMTEFEAVNKMTFDGTWDITKQYSPWTIVNDGQQGYISIQPVPAGILLSNQDYWRGVVDYTQTIADLQNRVVTAEGDINNLESAVDSLQDDLIKNGGGNALFIGDSYSTISTGYTKALPELLKDILKFDTIYNYAIGGAGYVNGDGTNEHFAGQLSSAISALTDDEKDAISYVFILGGQNDYGHPVADLLTQLNTIYDTAKAAFTNAQIVALPLWYNKAVTAESVIRFQHIYYYATLKGCLTDMNSWSYLITTNVTMMDAIHPSQQSLEYLAGCIADVVRGSNAILPQSSGVITVNSISGITISKCVATFENGIVHFKCLFTCPAGGLANGTELFKVAAPFIPRSGMGYFFGYSYSATSRMFLIDLTTGAITNNGNLNSNEIIMIDTTICLFETDSSVYA